MDGFVEHARWRRQDNRWVAAMDFVRHPAGGELLSVVDQAQEISLYSVKGDLHMTLNGSASDSFYDLTYVPQHAGWPHVVAVGGGDRVTVFDTSTGEVLASRHMPEQARLQTVEALLGVNGPVIAAGSKQTGSVFIWDWSRPDVETPIHTLDHPAPVRALKVLRQEGWLAVAHGGGITVWDIHDPSNITRVSTFSEGDDGHLAVVYDGHHRPLLGSSSRRGIQLWNPQPMPINEIPHASRGASPSEPATAVGSQVGRRFAIDQENIAIAAVLGPGGEAMIAAATGQQVTIWDPSAQTAIPLSPQLRGKITAIAKILAGDGSMLLAAGDETGEIVVWRQEPSSFTGREWQHRGWINAIVATRGQMGNGGQRPRRVAVASDDGTVGLWVLSPQEGQQHSLPHLKNGIPVQVQALAEAGEYGFVSGDEEGYLRYFDVRTPNLNGLDVTSGVPHRSGHGRIRAMTQYEHNGQRYIVAAGGEGSASIWTPQPLKRVALLRGAGDRDGLIRAAAVVSAPGAPGCPAHAPVIIALSDSGGVIALWDVTNLKSPRPVHQLKVGGQARALATVPSNDGPILVAGADDGRISLWLTKHHPDDGLPAWTAMPWQYDEQAHKGPVAALAAVETSDGWLLASGGADGRIRLWDLFRDRPAPPGVTAHVNWVRVLQPLGSPASELVSGGDDGTVRLWPISGGELVPSRHELLIRGFADRPAQVDLLGRTVMIDELAGLLRIPPRDEVGVETHGPQVVTIEGKWGSGKTSFMRLLRDRLEPPQPKRRTDARADGREMTPRRAYAALRSAGPHIRLSDAAVDLPPLDKVVTAWFNPWIYQSAQQVWSGFVWTIVKAAEPLVGETKADRQAHWLRHNLARVDRAALRLRLVTGILRPLVFAFSAIFLPILLLVATARVNGTTIHRGWWYAAAAVAGIGALGAMLATARRYFFGSATAYLPAQLFEGPIPRTVVGSERLAADRTYSAEAGELYWVHSDIRDITEDLAKRGYQMVIFVDDLDRCSGPLTAQVFEAIAGVLATRDAHAQSAPKFVLALDPAIVARRLTASVKPDQQGAGPGRLAEPDGDDGWSVLYKISQLPVVLPITADSHVFRLMRRHTPHTGSAQVPDEAVPGASPEHAPQPDPAGVDRPASTPADDAAEAPPPMNTRRRQLFLEGDPSVQTHLQELMRQRTRQTMRETKRLLNLWSFYIRVLRRTLGHDALNTARAACDVMTLAEIVARWPAFVPALTRTFEKDRTGLSRAYHAAKNSAEWSKTMGDLDLLDFPLEETDGLRSLLQHYANPGVVEYAYYLL